MKSTLRLLAPVFCSAAIGLFSTHHAPAQTILFSDDFNTDSSYTDKWDLFWDFTNGIDDYTAELFDYSSATYEAFGATHPIPPAPNSTGGAMRGLRLTVNNNDNEAARGGVSLYPKGQQFSGEFALKFDMWINFPGQGFGVGGAGQTEHATFGIHHDGDKANWEGSASTGSPTSDGVWFAVCGDGDDSVDYGAYLGDGTSPAVSLPGEVGGFLHDQNVTAAQPDTHPLKLMFPRPPFEAAGLPSKQWVEVEVRHRPDEFGWNTVTWLINGYVIAEHQQFFQASGNVMIGYMDRFPSISNPREHSFVIYDNVRVVDLTGEPPATAVGIEATDPFASEPGTNPGDTGTFTVSRTGSTDGPLSVEYRIGGTAVNGVDYVEIPDSVTIPDGDMSVEITITPIDNAIADPTRTVILTLTGGEEYDIRETLSATVEIFDDGDTTQTVSVGVIKPWAYERTGNHAQFEVLLGGTAVSPVPVNYTLSGTAVNGTDYQTLSGTVTIPAGETSAFVNVVPIDNDLVDGDRTVILTLSDDPSYIVGEPDEAGVTIRDDDHLGPAGDVLFSEDFEADNTANWIVNKSTGANANDAGSVADFFFDYSSVGIPPAPGSGGTTRGLKLQANLSGSVFSGLSVSPAGQNFSGDHRLRFNAWLNYHGPLGPSLGSGTTQVTGAGIGTSGTVSQWAGSAQESLHFGATGDGDSAIDYRAYSSAAATGYVPASGIFAAGTHDNARNETDPYYEIFGREAAPDDQLALYPNQTGRVRVGAQGFAWRDMVIDKVGDTVTWHIDGLLIATVDLSGVTLGGGNILFNYYDINAGSTTDPNAPDLHFGLIDNVRVYALDSAPPQAPEITGIEIDGGNVVIDFSAGAGDDPEAFKVHGAAVVTGPYAEDSSASVMALGDGGFRATVSMEGAVRFFFIAR